jgi:hypothetical protein
MKTKARCRPFKRKTAGAPGKKEWVTSQRRYLSPSIPVAGGPPQVGPKMTGCNYRSEMTVVELAALSRFGYGTCPKIPRGLSVQGCSETPHGLMGGGESLEQGGIGTSSVAQSYIAGVDRAGHTDSRYQYQPGSTSI